MARFSFIEHSERVIAAIHEDVAEIRASNARTDRQLLLLQQQADKYRQEREKERQEREKEGQARENEWKAWEERYEKDRRDFNKRMAEISDGRGRLIDDMVEPYGFELAQAIFQTEEALSCEIHVQRRHPFQPIQFIAYDLMAVGPTKLLIVEAKWSVAPGRAREFKEQMALLPEFFPEYAGKTLCPAVASVYLEPSVITFLNREKIYGIAMGDEAMEVVNLGQF